MSENNELSDREIEILRLVATGASNKEIAYKLSISPNTVKVHLKNIFGKIGVMSRTEAAMYAVKRGWSGEQDSNQHLSLNSNIIIEESITPDIKNVWIKYTSMGLVGLGIIIIIYFLISYYYYNTDRYQISKGNNQQIQNGMNRWSVHQSLSSGIYNHASIGMENKIYVIGGKVSEDISKEVWIFNVDENKWHQGSDLPEAKSDIGGAAIGGKIYVPGGKISSGSVASDLDVYNPSLDRWEKKANLPIAVSNYGIAPYEGKLYIFGGWNGDHFITDILQYDPGNDVWKKIGDLDHPRGYIGAVTIGEGIYILGGFDGKQIYILNQKFSILGEEGKIKLEEMPAIPKQYYGFCTTSVADLIFLYGGVNEGEVTENNFYQYKNSEKQWSVINPYNLDPNSGCQLVTLGTEIYIIGGYDPKKASPINEVVSYQSMYNYYFPVIK